MSSRLQGCGRRGDFDFSNRETLKKYVGVRDHLSRQPGTKSPFMNAPLSSRLQRRPPRHRRLPARCRGHGLQAEGLAENESDGAVEEVLDAHRGTHPGVQG
jgi:NADH dehydrogenase (ubiquinone) 1 alpha subcomplex subunit 5